jgi:hypothetical protein
MAVQEKRYEKISRRQTRVMLPLRKKQDITGIWVGNIERIEYENITKKCNEIESDRKERFRKIKNKIVSLEHVSCLTSNE